MMDEQEFNFQNAQNLMSMGEYEEGVKLLRELGDYPLALRLLGYAHYNGDGVEKDNDKALEYFVSAYEHGDIEIYERIHEFVCENLREYKKNRCDFKEEIEPFNRRLKYELDFISQTSMPYDESTQLLISMTYINAYNICCNIMKAFLSHQDKKNELSPRQLFLEGMKMGLMELEFISVVIPCHDKITEEVDLSITNQFTFSLCIMAMRGFMERVDEVINNKSDADILREIMGNDDKRI